VVQATVLDGLVFDAPPFSQDGFAAPEIDVSRCQVADALVVSVVERRRAQGEGLMTQDITPQEASMRFRSRLIDRQSQKMTVAARATADRKVLAQLS
jgi:hypothetical protein